MAETRRVAYTGIRFRETRGGTSDKTRALAQRGQGGVRFSVGDGRYAMMTEADAALLETDRAALVAQRSVVRVTKVTLPPVEPVTLEMVTIPEGDFLFGPDKTTLTLPGFQISKIPVTNRHYRVFMEATDYQEPKYWQDPKFGIDAKDDQDNLIGPDLPVVGVSKTDAEAYCKWAGVRLPTEFEYEKAARGTDGKLYPWGNAEPTSEQAVFYPIGRTMSVKRPNVEKGVSPYGVLDLAGNVWKWTSSSFGVLDLADPANPQVTPQGDLVVLRGGSWYSNPGRLRSVYRSGDPPESRDDGIGFFVAKNL